MHRSRPPVLGITGNIATGKSLVTGWLSSLGATVIDSDRIVHELYRPDHPVAGRVAARFGAEIVGPQGVARSKLGELVFADPQAMADLEAIVHPAVFEAVAEILAEAPLQHPHVIEAIKLVEGENAVLLDSLWVLESPRREQIARLASSRNLSPEEAALRIDAQSPANAKLELFRTRRPGVPARIVANRDSVGELRRVIECEWERFLAYCAGQ